MRTLFGFLLALSLISVSAAAQTIHNAQYSRAKRPGFCGDVLEIDSINKKAYFMNICGCILGKQIMTIGVSKYTHVGNLWTFTALPPAQFVSVGIRDYKRDEAYVGPAVLFIDIHRDTANIDSIIIFKPRKYDKPGRPKGTGLVRNIFNTKKLYGRTHFTLPYISRFFFQDMLFKIPDDEYNLLLVQLKFPAYLIPDHKMGSFGYDALNGKFTQTNDSTLVETNRRRPRSEEQLVFIRRK